MAILAVLRSLQGPHLAALGEPCGTGDQIIIRYKGLKPLYQDPLTQPLFKFPSSGSILEPKNGILLQPYGSREDLRAQAIPATHGRDVSPEPYLEVFGDLRATPPVLRRS